VKPWYLATEPFSPRLRPGEWAKYVASSGLSQLQEVVTLDNLLCPPVLHEIKAEYWPHIVNEDFMLHFFTDLEFMLNEVRHVSEKNVLCAFRNPESAPNPPRSESWSFVGYDLVDTFGGNSALTNCGGFPRAFSSTELSAFGLLSSLERAKEIRHVLREEYPEEHHAHCHVWALFRRAP
jgi:hypothetical protein